MDNLYSKGAALSSENPPTSDLPHETFPGDSSPRRTVQQIDLVPTFSLVFWLPSYSNLEMVIPGLFWRGRSGRNYTEAIDIKARTVHAYRDTYRYCPSGGELEAS